MWLACVSTSCASYASSDVPWQQMLRTRWFGLWSTLKSTTVIDFLLLVRSTCLRSYSLSFALQPDLFSSSHIVGFFFWHFATAAALARDSRSHQVQTVYAGIQMPAWTSSSLSVRSLHTRHGARSAEIICDTGTIAVYPPEDENQNVRILLCFVCSLERTPSASAWPWSFIEQF